MKLRVVNTFCDKMDHKTIYEAGMQIEIGDEQRARDIIDRGLAVEVKSPADTPATEVESPSKKKSSKQKKDDE